MLGSLILFLEVKKTWNGKYRRMKMGVLNNLVPEKVFYYFEELCNIPHGSKNTKAISDYCVNFAKERGLAYHQDASNNIIILKNGSKGYEDSKPVIIQGHLDMV